MSDPAVSVIVPNYNHARFLRQRIDSILAQTYQDFELILLDDCSTDDSREILRGYASSAKVTHVEFNETNSGSTFKQWKKGLTLARGKYVWIAESDDAAEPALLKRLVHVLEADPEVVLAYCRSRALDENGDAGGFVDSWFSHIEPPLDPMHWSADFCEDGREECKYLLHANTIASTSSVVFRRRVYDAVGGTDDTQRTSGDWKLWAAMALAGKVGYVSEPLNRYRCHAGTVRVGRASPALTLAEQLEVIRWLLDRVTPTKEALHGVCVFLSNRWVPAVMSPRVPMREKLRILRSVWAIDEHPLRRAVRPAGTAARLKIMRHWRVLKSAAGLERYANR